MRADGPFGDAVETTMNEDTRVIAVPGNGP